MLAGNPSTVTHVYADGPRSLVIKASAMDGDQSISSVTANVNVTNVAPTITVTGGAPAAEGAPYTVQFSATDPGTDTRTTWTVDWGDGKVEAFAANATSAQHVYMDDGTYAVVVSATDEDGTFAAAPVNASITNVAPTLDPLSDRLAAAAAGFQLTFTARDVVPEVFSGTIDWGDGSDPTPFAGSATTPLAMNTFAVDHTYATGGTYTVTVNLSDGDGGTATRTASVRVGDVVVRVYEDKNGNGVRDSGDPPRVGATAFLDLDRDGVFDAGEPTGTTDAFGDVLFDDLPATAHAARVVVPPNWHLSTPAAGFVDATPGTTSALATFGLTQAATVTGTLFDDVNANGVRDTGEGPLSTTVRARRIDGGTSVSALADAAGVYRFTGLLPGQYVIELTSTSRVVTAPHGRRGHVVTITGEQTEIAGLTIGSFAGTGATLSGTLYRDLNGNGTRDAGEPGVFNQTVYIDANDNGVRDLDEYAAPSSSGGGWTISRLPAGTYRVRQVLPPDSPAAADPAVARDRYRRARADHDIGRPRAAVRAHVLHPPLRQLHPGLQRERKRAISREQHRGVEHDAVHGLDQQRRRLGDRRLDVRQSGSNRRAARQRPRRRRRHDQRLRHDRRGRGHVRGGRDFARRRQLSRTLASSASPFDGRGGWDDVTASGGPPVTLDHGQALASLALESGAAARLATGGPPLLLRGLAVADGATLDVRDAGFIYDYTGDSPIGGSNGSAYTGVTGLIASAYNYSAWDGPGIATSMPDAGRDDGHHDARRRRRGARLVHRPAARPALWRARRSTPPPSSSSTRTPAT